METPRCENCGEVLVDIESVCEACDGGLIGDSVSVAWNKFAREVGGEFITEDFEVIAPYERWTIQLTTFEKEVAMTTTSSRDTWTSISARYLTTDGFWFGVVRGNILQRIAKLFGVQYFDVGLAAFVVRGNDEAKAKEFFSNPRIAELVQTQAYIEHFSAGSHGGRFSGQRPEGWEGEAVVEIAAPGVPESVESLRLGYELVCESLKELRRIGSASDEAPPTEG